MDDEVIGFGVQLRQTGRKSFTLDYSYEPRRRRLYIGDFPDWSVVAAREQAKRIKHESLNLKRRRSCDLLQCIWQLLALSVGSLRGSDMSGVG